MSAPGVDTPADCWYFTKPENGWAESEIVFSSRSAKEPFLVPTRHIALNLVVPPALPGARRFDRKSFLSELRRNRYP